jgi:hypothetical protein
MIQDLATDKVASFTEDFRQYKIFETTISATVTKVLPAAISVLHVNHTNAVNKLLQPDHPRNKEAPIFRVSFMVKADNEAHAAQVQADLQLVSMNAFGWQLDRSMKSAGIPTKYKAVTLLISQLQQIADPEGLKAQFASSTPSSSKKKRVSNAIRSGLPGCAFICWLCGILLAAYGR